MRGLRSGLWTREKFVWSSFLHRLLDLLRHPSSLLSLLPTDTRHSADVSSRYPRTPWRLPSSIPWPAASNEATPCGLTTIAPAPPSTALAHGSLEARDHSRVRFCPNFNDHIRAHRHRRPRLYHRHPSSEVRTSDIQPRPYPPSSILDSHTAVKSGRYRVYDSSSKSPAVKISIDRPLCTSTKGLGIPTRNHRYLSYMKNQKISKSGHVRRVCTA